MSATKIDIIGEIYKDKGNFITFGGRNKCHSERVCHNIILGTDYTDCTDKFNENMY